MSWCSVHVLSVSPPVFMPGKDPTICTDPPHVDARSESIHVNVAVCLQLLGKLSSQLTVELHGKVTQRILQGQLMFQREGKGGRTHKTLNNRGFGTGVEFDSGVPDVHQLTALVGMLAREEHWGLFLWAVEGDWEAGLRRFLSSKPSFSCFQRSTAKPANEAPKKRQISISLDLPLCTAADQNKRFCRAIFRSLATSGPRRGRCKLWRDFLASAAQDWTGRVGGLPRCPLPPTQIHEIRKLSLHYERTRSWQMRIWTMWTNVGFWARVHGRVSVWRKLWSSERTTKDKQLQWQSSEWQQQWREEKCQKWSQLATLLSTGQPSTCTMCLAGNSSFSSPYPYNFSHTALLSTVVASAGLSMFGSLFIILTYCIWKDLHTTARSFLVFVSIADFVNSCGNLIGVAAKLPQAKSQGCEIQSFFTTFSSLGFIFWTTFLAVFLWMSIVRGHVKLSRKQNAVFLVLGCGVPLAITIAAWRSSALGNDNSTVSAGWCWTRDDPEWPSSLPCREARLFWRIMAGKGWEVASYVIVPLLYLLVKSHINSEVSEYKSSCLIAS